MNRDQCKRGQWSQFKGELKRQWGKFTDDDLMQIGMPCRQVRNDRRMLASFEANSRHFLVGPSRNNANRLSCIWEMYFSQNSMCLSKVTVAM